ncbi:MAG: glycosyltransferase [Planctomycetaceae bacterium]
MSTPSVDSQRPKRILVYCQHLSGAGHFVRCREIIRALARRHNTWFMVGGPPVPGPKLDESIRLVPLPGIHRTPQGVLPLDSSRSLNQVFADRRIMIEKLLREIQPEVLIIEHFPFSKWLLREELMNAIQVARETNAQVQVISSVRDYPAGHEVAVSSSRFRNEVVPTLNQHFDRLLVHADPRVVTLESQFPWTREIDVPIHYTGYVAEKLTDRPADSPNRVDDSGAGGVLISSGGLRDGFRLANLCVAAWKELDRRDTLGGRIMEIFAGLFAEDEQYADLEESIRGGPFKLRRFSDNFLNVMSTADLSISQGGYNTTMNVLETRTQGILVPNRRTHDQAPRARQLADMGVVDCLDPAPESPLGLADLIHERLSLPRSAHDIALDGAEKTLLLIDSL